MRKPSGRHARSGAGIAILVAGMVILAGCAAGKQAVPAVTEALVPERSSVTRLQDGREGFIVLEIPNTDSDLRSDFERAVTRMKDGEYHAAIKLLEHVIELTPGVTAPYINVAMAYMRTDQLEKAEEHLLTALQLFPGHPVASNEYGLLLRKSGRFAEARTVYEKTLSIFPDYHPVRKNLGILCDLYLGDLACALEHYEIYSAATPKDEQAGLWVADLRIRLGR